MVLPLLLHGDAAFAGQGVIAECLGLSGLKGHRTGGSIHFVINNQIGFTTSPIYSRSSPYPTDVAKMIEAPVFHVNGDDPEAVVYVAKVATEFRQRFGKPVVIDMFCYRRFGHNEGDEPSFTQPLMYSKIRGAQDDARALFRAARRRRPPHRRGDRQAQGRLARTSSRTSSRPARTTGPTRPTGSTAQWKDFKRADADGPRRGETGVDDRRAGRDRHASSRKVPAELQRPQDGQALPWTTASRRSRAGEGIDWATGEALAFGTLRRRRPSGPPLRPGRRARHLQPAPLGALRPGDRRDLHPAQQPRAPTRRATRSSTRCSRKKRCSASSTATRWPSPTTLTLWEAQFGDFANGAQVVIDQFISSGERKWFRMSGLVMLLPHGYEGQGPEHSSARLERYLQLCAEDNMQVANCTTPANYFHVLRRQVTRDFRKPLVLMTPKSLLRHKRATSALAEMGPESCFHRLLWDDAEAPGAPKTTIKLAADDKIRRVVLCSGKVYYDLLEEREKRGINDVYLLRIEQLYPFPAKALLDELSRFKNAEIVWCQEEPKNMGAWAFVQPYLDWVLDQMGRATTRPRYVGRPASASTATGLMRHPPAAAAGLPRRSLRQRLTDQGNEPCRLKSRSPSSARASPKRPSGSGSRRSATPSPPTSRWSSSRPTR